MSIQDNLLEFHLAMGVPAYPTSDHSPASPSTERIQLRARILAEEAVREHLEAIGASQVLIDRAMEAVEEAILSARREFTNIVLVADSVADTIYVAEGTNLEYGIPGKEIFKEVHRRQHAKGRGPAPPGRQGDEAPGVRGARHRRGSPESRLERMSVAIIAAASSLVGYSVRMFQEFLLEEKCPEIKKFTFMDGSESFRRCVYRAGHPGPHKGNDVGDGGFWKDEKEKEG